MSATQKHEASFSPRKKKKNWPQKKIKNKKKTKHNFRFPAMRAFFICTAATTDHARANVATAWTNSAKRSTYLTR